MRGGGPGLKQTFRSVGLSEHFRSELPGRVCGPYIASGDGGAGGEAGAFTFGGIRSWTLYDFRGGTSLPLRAKEGHAAWSGRAVPLSAAPRRFFAGSMAWGRSKSRFTEVLPEYCSFRQARGQLRPRPQSSTVLLCAGGGGLFGGRLCHQRGGRGPSDDRGVLCGRNC